MLNSLDRLLFFLNSLETMDKEEFHKLINSYEELCLFTTELLLLNNKDKVNFLFKLLEYPNGFHMADYIVSAFLEREDFKQFLEINPDTGFLRELVKRKLKYEYFKRYENVSTNKDAL